MRLRKTTPQTPPLARLGTEWRLIKTDLAIDKEKPGCIVIESFQKESDNLFYEPCPNTTKIALWERTTTFSKFTKRH